MTDPALRAKPRGITLRAVLIGLVLTVVQCHVIPYGEVVVHGTQISHIMPPVAALFTFLVMALVVNAVWRRRHPETALSPAELLTIFAMLGAASGIAGIGGVFFLLSGITGMFYFASAQNHWAQLVHPHVPVWLAPRGEGIIRPFYEGLPATEPIPWGPWVAPIAAWSLFMVLVYAVMLFIAALLAQTWIRHERLTFPLVAMPIEVAQGRGPMFTRSGRVLAVGGALIPVALHAMQNLAWIYPSLPAPAMRRIDFSEAIVAAPWTGLRPVWLSIYPSIMAFTYYIPTEVSFSFWVFTLLRKLTTVYGIAAGLTSSPATEAIPRDSTEFPFPLHQATGGCLALAVLTLWLARRNLARTVRAALGRGERTADTYTWAFWGLLASGALLIAWCVAAGMSVWVALLSLGVFFGFAVALSRIVCEGGAMWILGTLPIPQFLHTTMGTQVMPRGDWIHVQMQSFLSDDTRCLVTPNLFHGFKMGDATQSRAWRIAAAMGAALAVGTVFSLTENVWLAYRYPGGAINLSSPRYAGRGAYLFRVLLDRLTPPREPELGKIGLIGLGAAVTSGLVYLRTQWVWWPLHPVGYVFANTRAMEWFWFSVLFAWLIKTLVLRYGGHRGFVRSLPFAHGLVIGEFASFGFWLIVQYALGIRHHRLFP